VPIAPLRGIASGAAIGDCDPPQPASIAPAAKKPKALPKANRFDPLCCSGVSQDE
jgi:hypothetical protein